MIHRVGLWNSPAGLQAPPDFPLQCLTLRQQWGGTQQQRTGSCAGWDCGHQVAEAAAGESARVSRKLTSVGRVVNDGMDTTPHRQVHGRTLSAQRAVFRSTQPLTSAKLL